MTMKRMLGKRAWYPISLIALVIIHVPLVVSLGHAQKTPVAEKAMIVQLYETGGRLTSINLNEKRAVIDGLTWELSEHFNPKGLPPRWIRGGGHECKNGSIVVRYYISLRVRSEEAPHDIGEVIKGKKARVLMDAEDIQELLNRGGKIYKIEVMPA